MKLTYDKLFELITPLGFDWFDIKKEKVKSVIDCGEFLHIEIDDIDTMPRAELIEVHKGQVFTNKSALEALCKYIDHTRDKDTPYDKSSIFHCFEKGQEESCLTCSPYTICYRRLQVPLINSLTEKKDIALDIIADFIGWEG